MREKNVYKLCVIYKAYCSLGSCYTGEAKHYTDVRWNEHNNPTKSSEPWKHLQNNITLHNNILHGLLFQLFQKILCQELRGIIYCSMEDYLYLEMVLHSGSKDIMQTPECFCN